MKEKQDKLILELEDEYCDFILYSVYCPKCNKYLGKYDTRDEKKIFKCDKDLFKEEL
jgi:hypothetical protein